MRLRGLSVAVFGLAWMGAAAWAQAASGGTPVLSEPKVYPFAEMSARKMPNGAESRDTLHGLLASGEAIAVHETVVPVGAAAPPQHVIQHSEIISVLEGTVAFEHGDKSETVRAGGVIYVAFGTKHDVKNIGDVPARYVVVAIGGDVKK